jgi:hypothetical protein
MVAESLLLKVNLCGRFRKLIPNVPVPEVYSWCRDRDQTFIYMQLIDGITLEDAWLELVIEEKYEICVQLHSILGELRQLRQDSTNPFTGKIFHVQTLGENSHRFPGSVDGRHIRCAATTHALARAR